MDQELPGQRLDQLRLRGIGLDPAALDEQMRRYRWAAQIGRRDTAARANPVMRKHHALARRLLDRQDDYLRFTTDWRIPPDNNGSERDIRMIKFRQKVSGCLRTPNRRQAILRDPQLPVHRHQTRQTVLRSPRHARRGQPLATRNCLNNTHAT
jgi:hypothetical protein